MDAAAIRWANLKEAVRRLEARTPGIRRKDVAIALDLSPSFLSQLLAGKKMGDDVARKIEAAQALSHGWMDSPQWHRLAEESPEYQSQPLRSEAEMLAASTRLVRLACESLEVSFDPEDEGDATLVLIARGYLRARSERQVTPDNVVDFTKVLRRRISGNALEGSDSAGRAGTGAGG